MASMGAEVWPFLVDLYNATWNRMYELAKVATILAILEILLPAYRFGWMAHLRGMRFWLVYSVINAALFWAIFRVIDMGAIVPLFTIDLSVWTDSDILPLKILGWFVACFAFAFFTSFFYYWLHRAQHAIPFLWRFHKVHHSIRDMSAWNCVHHAAEEIQQFAFTIVPMAFLLHIDRGTVPWIALFVVGMHAFYQHSSTRLNLGPLGYLICDNRYHRIHHSIRQDHHNTNFTTVTPLWDILFGTFHFPKPGEWPEVGLKEEDEPRRIIDYLVMPFKPARP